MRKHFVVLTALSLSACAFNRTIITEAHSASPKPVERLVVYVDLPTNGDRGIFHGFQRALASALDSCDVVSQILQGPPDRSEVAVSDVAPAGAPDAQLHIWAHNGLIEKVTVVNQYNQVLSADNFKQMEMGLTAELRDHKQDRVTWLAFANLHMERSGPSSGEQLADAIVAQLRSDGVLTRCH